MSKNINVNLHFSTGALPPKVDVRDYKVAAAGVYPSKFEITILPPVKNQGSVGSCVAHTASEILEHFNEVETGSFKALSTDFIYGMQGIEFNRRESGMFLRDACKIMNKYGDCSADTIPTNIEQPLCSNNLEQRLTEEIYEEAKFFKTRSYARCYTEDSIKHALMNYGPVMGSTKWYNEYKVKDKVIVFDKSQSAGYHAIMIYGWCPQGWLCQNSWGKNWNGDGRFILPFGEIQEAWSFVDEDHLQQDQEKEIIIVPKRNNVLDIIYKVINSVVNIVKQLIKPDRN